GRSVDFKLNPVEGHATGTGINSYSVDVHGERLLGSHDGELVPGLGAVHRRSRRSTQSERLIVVCTAVGRPQVVILSEQAGAFVLGQVPRVKADGISRKLIRTAVIDPDRRSTVDRRCKVVIHANALLAGVGRRTQAD